MEFAKNASKGSLESAKRASGDQYISSVKLAYELKDNIALQTAIKQMWMQYGGYSKERSRDVNSLFCQLADSVLPLVQKFMLWAANSNSSFYKVVPETGATKRIFNIEQKNGTSRDLDDPVHLLKFPQEELIKISKTGPEIINISKKIKSSLQKLHEVKNEIVSNVQELDKLIFTTIFSKLNPEGSIAFIEWIDSVKY